MKRNGLLRLLPLLLAAWLACVPAAPGATLFERSQERFALRAKQSDPADYSFVVLGDSRGNDKVFRRTLALAASYKPLFVLHGGDVAENGSREELDRFLAIVAEQLPETPLFVVVGNHERDKRLFAELIGPLNFTIDSARLDLKLVAVDNSGSALKPAALEYLYLQLREKRRTSFVAMHVPPKTPRWEWHTFSEGATELAKLLAGERVAMAFFSHVHQFDQDELAGVPVFITGGAGAPLVSRTRFPGEPLYHLLVVRVRNGRATAQMVEVEN